MATRDDPERAAPKLDAGGKLSTWFPLAGLVEHF